LTFLITVAVSATVWHFFLKEDRDPGFGEQPPPGPLPTEFRKVEEQRPLMGTLFRVVAFGTDEQATRSAMSDAFRRATEIQDICTDYEPDSELSMLTEARVGEPTEISPTLAAVLAHARGVAEVTDGAFDPTLGGLSSMWRRARTRKALPSAEDLAAAREVSGWKNFAIDPSRFLVTINLSGMQFDLGGIAKGYAADEMLAVLKRKGIARVLIAAGGDIRLGDPPPDAASWTVGLRTLGSEVSEVIRVSNCAVSTSGDLHQFVEIEGNRYSHIIDPETGLGLTRRIAATVVAPTAVQSDPLATFSCIEPEAALAAFNAGSVSCRVVTLRRGSPDDRRSQNFPPVTAF
jgi:thiamine biosynthesis lipoprotein